MLLGYAAFQVVPVRLYGQVGLGATPSSCLGYELTPLPPPIQESQLQASSQVLLARLSGLEGRGATNISGWSYGLAPLPGQSKRTSSEPGKLFMCGLDSKPTWTPNSLNSVTGFALRTVSSACCTQLQCFSVMKLPGVPTRLFPVR